MLTVAAGTTLQSDNTARILANNLTINGNTTFGGAAATHNLTFNGRVNLGSANRTLTVLSPQVTTTFGGLVSGTAGGLTKVGNGILTLSSANNLGTNAYIVRQGTLRLTGGLPQANAVTLGGASTFEVALASGASATLGALSFAGGDAVVRSTQVGAAQTLGFASLAARSVGATGNFVLAGGDASTNRIVLTGATANALLGAGYFFGGTDYAFVDAAGQVRAYGAGDAGYVADHIAGQRMYVAYRS